MTEIKVSIKVKDIIPLGDSTVQKLDDVMDKLEALSKNYGASYDIATLETLKREFNANLQYMAGLYAKIKVYKGPNHTYLENAIKRIKAEAMDIIISEGGNITSAEKRVYAHWYYTERIAVAESIVQFCIKVELKYEQYNNTLSSLVQSISVANKELTNSKMTNT